MAYDARASPNVATQLQRGDNSSEAASALLTDLKGRQAAQPRTELQPPRYYLGSCHRLSPLQAHGSTACASEGGALES